MGYSTWPKKETKKTGTHGARPELEMLYSNILRKAEVLAAALDGVNDQVLSFPTPQVRPLQRRLRPR